MLKVLNVSDRNLIIGGIRIAPLKFHIFDNKVLNVATSAKINSLSNLGLIKVTAINKEAQPIKINENTKKSNRKSK